jgi:hypothetical protein
MGSEKGCFFTIFEIENIGDMLSQKKGELRERWTNGRTSGGDWAGADKYIIYGMRRMCHGDEWLAERL